MAAMKLKQLECHLQNLESFKNPKIKLEQYVTPAHIASCMLYTIQSTYDDIENKVVADLGCGTGILSVGCCLLESAFVNGFDIDVDAMNIAVTNMREQEITIFDGINCDILSSDFQVGKFYKFFDTVIMNPPFGTHNKGADIEFLKIALKLSNQTVYSLHKSSTRQHILTKANDWRVEAEILAQLKFNLPHSYKFHKKSSVDINVDLFRFSNLQ